MLDEDIDVVIPWVDNTDPIWRDKAKQYIDLTDLDGERFRDYDTIKYAIRSVEYNMPWVHQIFLVTAGQKPSWFVESPKIKIINHDEFIPHEFLPTFSSIVITIFMHLIPEISEKFIVLNDDTFVVNSTKVSDYFRDGLPNDFYIERPTYPLFLNDYYVFNSLYAINQAFSKRDNLTKNLTKKFNFKYGLINNTISLFLSVFRPYLGFYSAHSAQPYLKTSFEECWRLFYDELHQAASHPTRNRLDVTDWLIRYYQLASSKFQASNPRKHKYFELGLMDDNSFKDALYNKKYLDICINDASIKDDSLDLPDKMIDALSKKFNQPSTCEL